MARILALLVSELQGRPGESSPCTCWPLLSGPFLSPYGATEIGAGIPLSGMSLAHPMGVDQIGRDVFSRVLNGAHIVILLSVAGTALGLVLGSVVGLLSAYVGGWLDEFVQRLIEAFVSIPYLVLGLLAVYAAGPELAGQPALMVVVIAIVYAPRIARMARAAALDVVTRDYVTAARLRGDSAWSIIWRDLAPNTASTLLVEFALRTGYAPALIGAFGFLGFGIQPPSPEWGLMISENRNLILVSPVTVLGPGLALASLVVAVNLTAEGHGPHAGPQRGPRRTMMCAGKVVEVDGLTIDYETARGRVRAVDDVSFSLATSEVLGLVGESGSGKSTVAMALLGHIAATARVVGGRVLLAKENLFDLSAPRLAHYRGRRIGFVPQNPAMGLSPNRRVGAQLVEVVMHHGVASSREQALSLAREQFTLVGLPNPDEPAAPLSTRALGRPAAEGLHRYRHCLPARVASSR